MYFSRWFLISIVTAMLTIIVCFALTLSTTVHKPYDEIYENFTGDPRLISSPVSDRPFGGHVLEQNPLTVLLTFVEPVKLAGFSAFFPGNLHSVGSFLPNDFKVYKLLPGGVSFLVDNITSNKQSAYTYKVKTNEKVLGYKLVFSRAAFDQSIQISNVRFFKAKKVFLIEGIIHELYENRTSTYAYWLYVMLFSVLLLIPGLPFIQRLSTRLSIPLSTEALIAISPLLTLLVLSVAGALFILTGSRWFFALVPIYTIAGIRMFVKTRTLLQIKQFFLPVALFIVSLLITTSLQIKRDAIFNLPHIEKYIQAIGYIPNVGGYLGYHADNTLQWGIARTYLHDVPIFSHEADLLRHWEKSGRTMFDRTPLFPVLLTPILAMFGEGHFVYQRFITALMSCYFPIVFLLLTQLFSRKVSLLTSLILLMSPIITFKVFNVEVYFKYIAFYPIMIALFLYKGITKSTLCYILIGLLIALSFSIHPIALPIATVITFLMLLDHFKEKGFNFGVFVSYIPIAAITFLPTLLLLVGWTLFSMSYITNNSSSGAAMSDNIYIMQLSTLSLETLMNKVFNTINLFIPDILSRSDEPIFSKFFRVSLISAITPFLFIELVSGLKLAKAKRYSTAIVLGFAPFLVFILALNPYSLGGYTFFYPFVMPFLIGISLTQLLDRSRTRVIISLVLTIFFMLIPIYWYFDMFAGIGVFTDIRHISFPATFATSTLVTLYILLSCTLLKVAYKN